MSIRRVISTFVDGCHYSDTGWAIWQNMEGGGTRCTCEPAPAPCGERPKGQDAEQLGAKPADAVTREARQAPTPSLASHCTGELK